MGAMRVYQVSNNRVKERCGNKKRQRAEGMLKWFGIEFSHALSKMFHCWLTAAEVISGAITQADAHGTNHMLP